MLVDTHAHLNFRDFKNDLDEVVSRSMKAGVTKIICASSNVRDAGRAIKLAKKYPGVVFASVGIHPQKTDPENKASLEDQIDELASLAKKPGVVAVGETGLDYSPAPPGERDRTQKDQAFLFEKQIEIAQENNLPLLIHTREAFGDTVQTISDCQARDGKKLRGVFHCYSAGKKGIEPVLGLGFYFGVDGNLTYDEGMQNVFSKIPLERILLETDAPFLSPVPFRGQRNEPKNVKNIVGCLAKVKGISSEETSRQTSKNVKELFNI
jgi:TatD DNase family protein